MISLAAIYSIMGSMLYKKYQTMKTKDDDMFEHLHRRNKKKKELTQIDKIMKT